MNGNDTMRVTMWRHNRNFQRMSPGSHEGTEFKGSIAEFIIPTFTEIVIKNSKVEDLFFFELINDFNFFRKTRVCRVLHCLRSSQNILTRIKQNQIWITL